MTIHIALIRGINVGGKNTIKMAELRRVLEENGLMRVQTYIQSGNILFESERDESVLRTQLEQLIEAHFGITTRIILRTAEEIERIASLQPFLEESLQAAEETGEGESFYVSMMLDSPDPEEVASLARYSNESEQFHVEGRDIYLFVHMSIRDSKLAQQLAKLTGPATVRNRRTIQKLTSLAQAMERGEG